MIKMNFDIEITKLVIGSLTPILLFIFGVLILKRIERTKAMVSEEHLFRRKWADEVFLISRTFSRAVEDLISALFSAHDNQVGQTSPEAIKSKIDQAANTLTDIQLRLRLLVDFAPLKGPIMLGSANECFSMVATLMKTRKGNFDDIIECLKKFNQAAKDAHAEILSVRV
jgi:hypothetical protein